MTRVHLAGYAGALSDALTSTDARCEHRDTLGYVPACLGMLGMTCDRPSVFHSVRVIEAHLLGLLAGPARTRIASVGDATLWVV